MTLHHPTRLADLRSEIDGDLQQSAVENDVLVLREQADQWKAAFEAKGWRA